MEDILITFGFAWMTLAAVLGLHLGVKHERHIEALERLAGEGRLLDYHREHSAYRQRVAVHAHGFLFSLVCVATGLAISRMAYPDALSDGLTMALMGASVIWFTGGLWRIRALMGMADFVFLGSLIVAAVGLAKGLL